MQDGQRKALVDGMSQNGQVVAEAAELEVINGVANLGAFSPVLEVEEEDQGAADIEFVTPTKVKILIDVDRLDWDDFLTFEKLTADKDNPESLDKILAICRRCVVNHENPMKLPLSTFRPVMEAISKGIQGRSNRKN